MSTKGSRGNVLYVDDEEGNLLAFSASFRKFYDNVYTARTAREGIDIMRSHTIDVVLTDQRMPDMTGIQFLEKIRPEFPDTVRVIVTGFSDIDAVINAINTGRVFRYVQKPWNNEELKECVDQAIKTRRLELANRELVDVLQNEIAQKEQILKTFQKYVPDNVIHEMKSPSTSHLADTRVVSVLFVAMRGFNKLFAKSDSAKVIQFLNDYLTMMSECIGRHKGFINKLIGDGVLVIFGAPTSYLDNTLNAIHCALEMVLLLDKIKAKSGYEVEIGIGIDTGETIVGNVGSPNHIEYTVVGDTVNTVMSVQELAYDTPNGVLITQSTYDEVKKIFECEALGERRIPGLDATVNIYRVIKPL